MFCNQCEQTAKGGACTKIGTCGKDHNVSVLQDLLTYTLEGLSRVAHVARKKGIIDPEVNEFTASALFTTLTNVNFDPERFVEFIRKTVELRERLKGQTGETFTDPATSYFPPSSIEEMIKQAESIKITPDDVDPDIRSLMQTVLYGVRGIAAYTHHAQVLGYRDDAIYAFIHEAMSEMLNTDKTLEFWVDMALRCGEANLKTMELLDRANTETYGHPEPTSVSLGKKKGKAILVSGHDLKDLYEILKQTEGKGINVYTHGEMLPAHAYPELKKFKHLAGHYGTAWQNQHIEFKEFPGAIVMTTNCLQRPHDSYKDRIFTSGVTGWPGVVHIKDYDFSPVIEKALEMPGYEEDEEGKTIMTGFARNAVMSVAQKVIEAVKSGAIRHFILVGGCDGAKPGRSYYTEIVEKAPKDTVILTLACGKFRFFDKDLGSIDGIPRLLDIGQCNDAYSAIQIALALSEAFGVGVNDLPLSLVLSWYEQKAVSILLTLLYLGIKDIRLGPTLPAFITENVLNLLVEKYNIKPITTPEKDLYDILCSGESKSEECEKLAALV